MVPALCNTKIHQSNRAKGDILVESIDDIPHSQFKGGVNIWEVVDLLVVCLCLCFCAFFITEINQQFKCGAFGFISWFN